MSFGESAENYHNARYSYPREIFNYIGNQVNHKDKKTVLDLGCGTGIATAELEALGFLKIVGCDIDEDMISTAKLHKPQNIEYIVSSINEMDCKDNTYDIATAFGAFHWFCDPDSINVIKRILKPKGMFFVINKNDIGDFRNIIIDIISQYSEPQQAFQKSHYFPERILTNFGFQKVHKINFNTSEKFNLKRFIAFAQSMKLWNHIHAAIKPQLIEALTNHFSKEVHDGYYERKVNIEVVHGIN